VPEAERNRREQQSGIAAAPVGHEAIIAGGVEHASKLAAARWVAKHQGMALFKINAAVGTCAGGGW
jgi:hypothetical protein